MSNVKINIMPMPTEMLLKAAELVKEFIDDGHKQCLYTNDHNDNQFFIKHTKTGNITVWYYGEIK